MKLLIISLLALVTLISNLVAAPPAQNLDVVLSARLPKAQLEAVYGKQLELLCNTAPAHLHVRYLDGEALTTIADLTVSEVVNPRGRAKQMEAGLAQLRRWCQQSLARSEPKDGRLDVPAILDFIGREPKAAHAVLLVGSPVYLNEREPGYSFLSAKGELRVPNDAMLALSHLESPFGVLGKADLLKPGVTVHWYIPDQSVLGTDLSKARLQRMWTLFVSQQGGKIVSFNGDLTGIQSHLLRTDLTPLAAELVQSADSTPAMVVAGREVGQLNITNRVTKADLGKIASLPKFTQVLILDRTGSMGERFSRVAAYVSLLPTSEWYGMWLYSDHEDSPATELFREGNDPASMAKALREIKLTGGGDIPESLEDALHDVLRELIHREVANANITIFTDAPAHLPAECPHAYDYRADIQKLLQAGHTITLVKCHPSLKTDWLPKGVNVRELP